MSNIVYLKHNEEGSIIAYNKSSLTSISLYKYECSTRRYDDLADINWHIGHDLQNDYFDCDKSEFDQALNKFEATLKDIKEQL